MLCGARLIDATGLQLFQTINTQAPNVIDVFWDVVKRYWWRNFRDLRPAQMCLAGLAFEAKDDVKLDVYENRLVTFAGQFGGICAKKELAERLFFMSKVKLFNCFVNNSERSDSVYNETWTRVRPPQHTRWLMFV
jgi:hypothetical protein